MTVQELINKLNAVQDKSKKVSFSYDFGIIVVRDPLGVIAVNDGKALLMFI